MNPDQVMLVQASFARIAPDAGTFVRLFYERLFALAPSLQALFRGDPQTQHARLAQALAGVVHQLDRIEALHPTLTALGARHASYGVVEADYATVGRALIDSLRQTLGPRFTAPVEQAWKAAYVALAGAMVSGAREAGALAA